MATCLERRSDEERSKETARKVAPDISTYTRNEPYENGHEDALSGGKLGRGVKGDNGHGHSLPNCEEDVNGIHSISYQNFHTSPKDNIGTDADINERNTEVNRELYSFLNPYESNVIITDHDGQYYVP